MDTTSPSPAGPVTRGALVWWREATAAVVVLVSRILSAPKTPWENDEFLFASAVRNFDPSRYHPHPPGFPLYVLLGKAVAVVVRDPWQSLVVVGILAAPIGVVALSRAFYRWTEDADLSVCGALLYYFSASMLVHGTLALSDGAAMMFLALALFAVAQQPGEEHERNAMAVGLWTSAAIGCRPQLLIPVIPMFVVALWRMRTHRQRIAALAVFGFVSLMWFLPLVEAAGGMQALLAYETKQAAYFSAHDAAMSRGAMPSTAVAIRFLLHPWGSKYLTLPLLAMVVLGAREAYRRRWVLLPLLLFTAVQLWFELGWMDPADGARYSLPSMMLIALVASFGLRTIRDSARIRLLPILLVVLFAAMTIGYVSPILAERRAIPSPPAAAAAFLNAGDPRGTTVLYDPSTRPHVEYLLPRFRSVPIEQGLREAYSRPDMMLVMFLDGGSHARDTHVFSWPPSDAYGKLTRNFYRQVSVDPITPEERYLPVAGVYALERTIDGDEWRWLQRDAVIRVAPRRPTLALSFRLSNDSPYETSVVTASAAGQPAHSVTVRKHDVATLNLPLPAAAQTEVHIHSEQSFAPASILQNQDPRLLAVQLTGLEQR